MLVVVSRKSDKKHMVYHRLGCIYAKRIKAENRKEMSVEQAQKRHYQECKYCAGLLGDVRDHKKTLPKWEQKYHMKFTYEKAVDTLYIQTDIGFWKMYLKEGLGKYLLYHRNTYAKDMDYRSATFGDFHRQVDVKATESLQKIVEYIAAHDRAKVIIMDDYRKLPRSTKQQKKYYQSAERKAKKKAGQRLDALFAALESSESGMKAYSFC